MQTAEHIERVAAEAVVDLAADGVVYHEVRFAPELHTALAPQEAVEAVTAGLRRGEAEAAAAGHAISAHVICCAMRTADRSLEIARPRRHDARHATTRSSRSTSPARRPASRRRSTPRRWRSPGLAT